MIALSGLRYVQGFAYQHAPKGQYPSARGSAPSLTHMPYSLRLLENGSERTLENGIIRALELVPDDSQQVSCVYPKTWYAWTDRTGITNPDVTGPYQLANLTPVSTADAGTLVITADWHSRVDDDRHRRRALGRTRQPDLSQLWNAHTQRVVQERGRELHRREWI